MRWPRIKLAQDRVELQDQAVHSKVEQIRSPRVKSKTKNPVSLAKIRVDKDKVEHPEAALVQVQQVLVQVHQALVLVQQVVVQELVVQAVLDPELEQELEQVLVLEQLDQENQGKVAANLDQADQVPVKQPETRPTIKKVFESKDVVLRATFLFCARIELSNPL